MTVAMISVMIAWRKRAVHEEADTEINICHRSVLQDAKADIAVSYRGLSVDMMLDGFDNSAPTFKEIASLIHATGDFIRELESFQFQRLDTERYLRGLILEGIYSAEPTQAARQAEMKQRLQGVWGKDIRDRPPVISRFLQRQGLSQTKKYDYSVAFDDDLISKISHMRTSDILDWLLSDDNSVV
ncbi:hypothetical protein ELI00_22730 [Rhizobium ruizarguesonis]|nr:hypothetical protein ELI00_22730 [Rhizobium ruizarguesonis]